MCHPPLLIILLRGSWKREIMDRMKEVTKQWEDYQVAKSSMEVLEAHVSHNSFFNQVPQHGGTPPIGLEVEDGSGISSKAPDIPKDGHKESGKGDWDLEKLRLAPRDMG
ncbi:uncharacterized protein LOC110270887 [Arachis ipaensis]|uniref:uncharacterized protein LOC110270887 n=1 Tax=Arachis ipaensis TaxID=130454 RepID=UPI000A2B9978|nr:uncharacterized protein LOC110270887 [Arachis ipaensis]XP_025646129.1 uncharacterized protein LOC112741382 [Arachis hypogaea]